MPKYVLKYFNARSRAEGCRMLFHVAGVQYDDVRVGETGVQPFDKKEAPMGQVPILYVDDQVICQSHTMERFLGAEFGLLPDSILDQAKADMFVECLEDTLKPCSPIFHATGQDEIDKIRKFRDELLPPNLTMLEAILERNGGESGFVVGDKMSYADVVYAALIEWPDYYCNEPLDLSTWPRLAALRDKIEAHLKIAEWKKIRPTSQY